MLDVGGREVVATELLVGAADEASDVVTPALDSTTELTCAEVVGVADVVGATEEATVDVAAREVVEEREGAAIVSGAQEK